ncbi:hypothetical protein AVMA1855_03200 [Acidovorax sp. SUPP1855]|uniref:hypothetical protein n=1 Tax=Acidovorax sp. SUPP1855 TaxID=431774 RepID=UPI0023DE461F|nr:hypothetical protein [Acidovorax sp. SUPP1855]GKS83114.1 hypothetical protein AVMA1855_03200 [Acidovorax sp. SUPP1855]
MHPGADRCWASSRSNGCWRPLIPVRIRQTWGCERLPIGLAGGINIFTYATNTLNWIDPFGLSTTCPNPPKKEIEIEAGSFEEARNIALMKMGTIDPSSRAPQTGRLGAGKGRKTGFTGLGDGEFKRFRLDYDPDKGPHINVEVGKGACAKKWAIKFPGNEETFKKLLKRNT